TCKRPFTRPTGTLSPPRGEGWGEGSVWLRKPAFLEIIAQSFTTPGSELPADAAGGNARRVAGRDTRAPPNAMDLGRVSRLAPQWWSGPTGAFITFVSHSTFEPGRSLLRTSLNTSLVVGARLVCKHYFPPPSRPAAQRHPKRLCTRREVTAQPSKTATEINAPQ